MAKRGPKQRLHKRDFTALYPSNYRRFFSLVGLYGYGVSLKAWDKASRVAAWKAVVREIKIESGMNNKYLAIMLDRTVADVTKLFNQAEEPPMGFALDICFIFDIDPLRVYPELAWMRDRWMDDFKVHLKAAQIALDGGELGVLREALVALEKGAAAWQNPELEPPMTKLLIATKGEYTQRYAEARRLQKGRNSRNGRYPDEIAGELYNDLQNDIQARREPYEKSTQERIDAKKGG